MMKKIISVILSAILMFMFISTAFAASGNDGLRFNEDGKFTIANICDIQDVYPMDATAKQFLTEMLATIHPDIVVLGGDNTVAPKEVKADAVKELCDIFVEGETYFTFVFGNHDNEQGVTKEELLSLYQQYGGKYCLAYDADPELFGVGTHNLPVLSSDGSKVAFNLFMMDSNTYYSDLGYDAVHEDQLEWYKGVAAQLKEENGGEVVHSMMFQHIIVQEIYDKLFIESPVAIGEGTQEYEDTEGNKHYYTYLPKISNIEDGYIYEKPCPGYKNFGQLDAAKESGDVIAIFSGHDHTNSFTVDIDGIKIVNTPGATFHSYGNDLNRGCRIITVDEKDTSVYEDYVWTVCDQALTEGSKITELGAVTKARASFFVSFRKFMNVFMEIIKLMFVFIK